MKGIDWNKVYDFIDENKPLMTWKELTDKLNRKYKVDLAESTYRKPYTIYKRGLECAYKNGSEQEIIRISNARLKLKIEQQITQKEKYQANEVIKKLSTYELFNREVIENIQKGYPTIKEIKLNKISKEFYMVCLGDLHYKGYEDLNIIFSEVLSLIIEKQKELKFKHIIIAELGDTTEGATIRPSQLLAIKKGMIDQVLDVAKYYSEFLTELSKKCKITFLCVTRSNHTQLRNLGTKRDEIPTEDTMKVLAEYIKARVENNSNIKIITDDIIFYKNNNINFMFEHGHQQDVNKKNYAEVKQTRENIHIDYLISGHIHHYSEQVIQDNENFNMKRITCPKMCLEETEYEKRFNFSSKPAILFCTFNEKGNYNKELYLEKSLKHVQQI